jgi:hypothetical protein
MPSQSDPTAQTLLGHLTDTKGAHELSDLTVDGVPADVALAAQYAPLGSTSDPIVYNVRDFGAVGDNVTDDGPAVQAAVDAAKLTGGGVIFFPPSATPYRIATTVSAGIGQGIVSIVVEGAAATIRPTIGSAQNCFGFANLDMVEFRNLRFIGTAGATYDAYAVISIASCSIARISNCHFDSLLTQAASGGGIVRVDHTDLTIENTLFMGCGGHPSPLVPGLHVVNTKNLNVRQVRFFDVGTLGAGRGSTPAWIRVGPKLFAGTDAWKTSALTFENLWMDEGGLVGLQIDGGTTNPFESVTLDRVSGNGSPNALGGGFFIDGVTRLEIFDCMYGYNTSTVNKALKLSNINTATVERMRAIALCNVIEAASTVGSLSIEDCTYTTLTTDPATELRINPVRNRYVATATTSNLTSDTAAINTINKFTGKQVWNTTTGRPVWADGPLATDTWSDATGTTAHTPAPPAGLSYFTGGTEVEAGGYRYHTFNSSGTLTFVNVDGPKTVEYLVVAGGGGGGGAGSVRASGGGGGGAVGIGSVSLSANQTVTIGAGGIGGQRDNTGRTNGDDTVFGSITKTGGGAGAAAANGNNGGSGGGESHDTSWAPGTATDTLGNDGGTGFNSGGIDINGGGGGGGAGAVGGNAVSGQSGVGGAGVEWPTGSGNFYGGGGGGGAADAPGGSTQLAGAGGAGGGGAGALDTGGTGTDGANGTANTGGGGGGGANSNAATGPAAGGDGGSGVVIVRYLI